MIWIILLAFLAVAANATMDEIRFHWDRIFRYWFIDKKYPAKTGWIEGWFNPSISWQNKYWSKNKYIQWIFMSPLVFITDFWHFLKFIMLNSIYGIIILLIEVDIRWWWLLIGFNFAWGVVYEFTYGVYGVLGDRKKFVN